MLDVKKVLSKILNWSGFGFTWDANTNNTADSWILVTKDYTTVQHRVLSRNQTHDFKTVAKSLSVTVNAGATSNTYTIDVGSDVSGYAWGIVYVNNSNINLIACNYWQSGTTVNAVFWNRASSRQTGNMQVVVQAWKSDT